MGFDWCCGQVGNGHESNWVKYLLKESFWEQSSYNNISRTKNAGFECCLLLQMVKRLVVLKNAEEIFFDHSSFELQTGSFIPDLYI